VSLPTFVGTHAQHHFFVIGVVIIVIGVVVVVVVVGSGVVVVVNLLRPIPHRSQQSNVMAVVIIHRRCR